MIDVVLPVLNEAGAIPAVLRALPRGFTPIVVDNGSTDGSAEVARTAGARVITEPMRGFGAACHAGLSAATTEIVCFMDCDATLDPRDLTRVVEPVLAGVADLVLGARQPEPGSWSPHARVANRVLARVVSRRAGVRIHDLGPMRAARREPLLALDLRDRRFGYPLEMVLRASERGWRITEVDVTYRARTSGRSKVTGTLAGSARAMRDMISVGRA
jgi:glycosyltransferase involved in cell wall biosynthesis